MSEKSQPLGTSPADPAAAATGEQAGWRQRAVDRSTQSARLRAAKRVQRFLDSAREIIADRQATEFTVQEVVDRSNQSLRSFYQYFDGKHELLLALFEEEIAIGAERLQAVVAGGDPLDRLEAAVLMLHDLSSAGQISAQPLFFEFAQRLLVSHPNEVSIAYAPMIDALASIVREAADAGLLRPGRPRRTAVMVLQTATVVAGRNVGSRHPITGAEVWDFCLHAIASDDVVAARQSRSDRGSD